MLIENARTIADRLFDAETAIEAAMTKTAELVAGLPAVREEARLSTASSHRVFKRTTRTLVALTEAHQAIVQTHSALSDVQRKTEVAHVAFGPYDDKPEEDAPKPSGVHLRPVGAAA